MADNEIHFPDLGDFKDVLVIDVMVKAGDRVEVDTPLVTLETDKATMDVPSPSAGVIGKLHVAKGDKVNSGQVLATLEESGAAAADDAEPDAAAESKPAAGADAKKKPAASEAEPARASKPAGDESEAEPVESAEAPKADEGSEKAEAEPVESAETPKADEGKREAAKAAPKKGSRPDKPEAAPAPASSAAPTPPAQPASATIDEAAFAKAHASPSVRAFARELGVDLGRVRGSGRKGRVTSDDVKAFVKTAMTAIAAGGDGAASTGSAGLPRVPAVDFAKFGPVEVVPLTRIQRISGPRLHASWVNLPHVTQFEDADVTELEEARRWLKLRASAEGIGLTSLAFVLRACVLALKAYPKLGASLDANGQNLVLKKYCHLGFAADTPDGLVVPVIRYADQKDVFELARALGDLSGKARTGKLSAAEMQGGCFTVSNLGGIGGTSFTPIINAPEVAVLGVSRAVQKPVWKDGAFVPRLMLPLSLSYDHRVVDGADGARFVGFLAKALADVAGLMAPL